MSKKKPAKKRNPNDTTFRNINALKKQIEILSAQIGELYVRVEDLEAGTVKPWGAFKKHARPFSK